MRQLIALWVLLASPVLAQYAPGGGGGGGGGGTILGTLPATPGCLTYSSGATNTLATDCNNVYYPTGIADPAPLVVTAIGATTATTYGYQILLELGVLVNGVFLPGIGSPAYAVTNPSTETTLTGNSTLDGTNYNHVVLPSFVDANVQCIIVRSTGPQSPQVVYQGACGTPFDDQANGAITPNFAYVGINFTAGTLLQGGVLVYNPILNQSQGGAIQLGIPIAVGGSRSTFGQLLWGPGWIAAAYLGDTPTGARWDIAYAGPSWFVQGVDGTNSPYTATRADGFLKMDTSGGARTAVLPDPSADATFPLGRVYVMHKPGSDLNAATLTASAGTSINGNATYVTTCPYGSVSVYWDGAGWPTMSREPFCGQGTLGGNVLTAGACDTPITISIVGARSGMAVNATPEGSPGAGTFTQQWVSSNDTVTAQVCESVAGTPTSRTYDFRVIQ